MAIAVGEIVAGLLPGAPSLVVSIGTLVIDLQPPGAKDVVVSLFGTNDKLALNVLILIVAVAVGGSLGLVARSRFSTAAGAFVAFGVVALYASLRMGIDSPVAVAGHRRAWRWPPRWAASDCWSMTPAGGSPAPRPARPEA